MKPDKHYICVHCHQAAIHSSTWKHDEGCDSWYTAWVEKEVVGKQKHRRWRSCDWCNKTYIILHVTLSILLFKLKVVPKS